MKHIERWQTANAICIMIMYAGQTANSCSIYWEYSNEKLLPLFNRNEIERIENHPPIDRSNYLCICICMDIFLFFHFEFGLKRCFFSSNNK